MSKSIREIALNKENTEETDISYFPRGKYHPRKTFHRNDFTDLEENFPYEDFENLRNMNIESNAENEDFGFLKPGEIKITVSIPQTDCGTFATIGEKAMLDKAEKLALEKIKRIIPTIDKDYTQKTSKTETYDEVEVSVTLSPLN